MCVKEVQLHVQTSSNSKTHQGVFFELELGLYRPCGEKRREKKIRGEERESWQAES